MITRDDITHSFDRYEYNSIDVLLDIIESNKNRSYYILQYVNETVLIYDTSEGKYLTWYKITHIGRSFTTNIETVEELDAFIDELMCNTVTTWCTGGWNDNNGL